MRTALGFASRGCVVTFGPFADMRAVDGAGFGEDFLRNQQVDAIHVLPKRNDWYQHPGLPDVCRLIAARTAAYERVIAFGSSMGGYAAIRYGGWAGADVAFALSPQFTPRPLRPPFDQRWRTEAISIRFTHESTRGFTPTAVVAYDRTTGIDATWRSIDDIRT